MTPCPVPDAPATVTATAAANRATIVWTLAADNGTPISDYVVTAYRGTTPENAIATEGSATTTVISGLRGGTAYTFRVFARSACGDGAPASSTAVTPTGTATTYASSVLSSVPLAYYRLGENPAAVAADSSGGGALGTYGSATQGTAGAAVDDADTAVNGNGGCCIASAYPSLPVHDEVRTIEAWIKPTDGYARYIAGWGTSATDEDFSIYAEGSAIGVVAYDDDRRFSLGRSLVDGRWHHVAVVYDGAGLVAYVDGQSLGTQQFDAPLDTVDGYGLRIGGGSYGQSPFYGDLDEVAVYDTALSASQVAAHFTAGGYSRPSAPAAVTAAFAGDNQVTVSWGIATASNAPITRYRVTAYVGASAKNSIVVAGNRTAARLTGLAGGTTYTFKVTASNAYGDGPSASTSTAVASGPSSTYASTVLSRNPSAYYRLGESGVPVGANSVGAGPLVTFGSATLGRAGAIAGDADKSVSADGTGLVGGGPASLPINNAARSVEAWVKPTDEAERRVVGWGSPYGNQAFDFYVQGSTIGVAISYDQRRAFAAPYSLVDGAWHHVVVTYDGLTLRAYADGLGLGARQLDDSPLDTVMGSGVLLGGGGTGGQSFAGGLDEVAVYPSALSSAQVLANFVASGHARPGSPGNLVATAGANRVVASWSPPAPGVDPVTRYVATAYAGTAVKASDAMSGASTSVTLTGLPGGTAYTVKVIAANAYGDGAAATSAAVTPTGPVGTYPAAVLAQAPVAYYRLGETSGRVAADSSAYGHRGAYRVAATGSAGAIAGDANKAVTNDAGGAVATAAPALPLHNDARSLEAWISPSGSEQRYIGGWGASGGGEEFSVRASDATLGVDVYGSDRSFALPSSIADGAWHHVVVTYDGSSLRGYLDGLALGARQFADPLNTGNATGLVLGASAFGGAPSAGGLDEVAVYATALTSAQVAAHFAASGHARPSAVTGIVATAGPNRATVSWSPAASGTDAVQRYVVTAYAGAVARNAQAMSGSATSVTLTGLAGATAYTFAVVASNAYGVGATATSAAVTPTGPAATYSAAVLAQAPVAYYRLGETSGATAADSSGNARLGTFGAATLGGSGALVADPNKAVSADGSCCAVSATVATLPAADTARSVEAWIKPSDASVRSIAGWGTAAVDRAFGVRVGGSTITVVAYGDDRDFTAPASVFDGAWHHVVVTYSAPSVTTYLDGVALGTKSFTSALNTVGSTLLIGGSHDGTAAFYGGLDDVAIYRTALTSAQVAAHFAASGHSRPSAVGDLAATAGPNRATVSWSPPTSGEEASRYVVTAYAGSVAKQAEAMAGSSTSVTMTGLAGGTSYSFKVVASNAYGAGAATTSSAVTPTGSATTYATGVIADGPVAYYRLGETSGATAADSSGNARLGTYERAELDVTGALVGDANRAARADGGCCAVRATVANLPASNAARSVEAWFKPSDDTFRYVAGWGTSSGERAFSVGVGGSRVGVIAYGDDRWFPAPSSTFDGAWHHLAVTYTGTSVTAYLDGLSLGTKTFTNVLNTLGSALNVGAAHDGSAPFYGDLDEVAVYPVALTGARVAAHFAASGHTRPAAVTDLVATAGPNRATVSWTPAASGGDAVTRYVVTAYAGSVARNAEATSGSSTSVTLSGLAGGTAYTFSVVARNAYGASPAATSAAVTPTGPSATYATAVLAEAPVAYYRLGEASGAWAADSSGNGWLAPYGRAGLGIAGAIVGDTNRAVSADAVCCVASGPVGTLPSNAKARSVEAWIKPSDESFRYVAGWGMSAPGRAFSVGVGGASIGLTAYGDDRSWTAPASTFDGEWHHLVVTYNGTSATAYLDGVSLGAQALALNTLGTTLWIGGGHDGWTPWYGGLDDVAIYKTALTAAQVAAHYAASGQASARPLLGPSAVDQRLPGAAP